jgi:hypothetical protein
MDLDVMCKRVKRKIDGNRLCERERKERAIWRGVELVMCCIVDVWHRLFGGDRVSTCASHSEWMAAGAAGGGAGDVAAIDTLCGSVKYAKEEEWIKLECELRCSIVRESR